MTVISFEEHKARRNKGVVSPITGLRYSADTIQRMKEIASGITLTPIERYTDMNAINLLEGRRAGPVESTGTRERVKP